MARGQVSYQPVPRPGLGFTIAVILNLEEVAGDLESLPLCEHAPCSPNTPIHGP